jgi:hypothetical protein
MVSTTENRTRQWGFVLRSEDGSIVGYGRVEAEDRIKAVSTARMVRLDDVIPALPMAVAGVAADEAEAVAPLNATGGVVLEWSTSNQDGA